MGCNLILFSVFWPCCGYTFRESGHFKLPNGSVILVGKFLKTVNVSHIHTGPCFYFSKQKMNYNSTTLAN